MMINYRVQYFENNRWQNYISDDKSTIFFFTLDNARSVAWDISTLIKIGPRNTVWPSNQNDWRIVDSYGIRYPLTPE